VKYYRAVAEIMTIFHLGRQNFGRTPKSTGKIMKIFICAAFIYLRLFLVKNNIFNERLCGKTLGKFSVTVTKRHYAAVIQPHPQSPFQPEEHKM
jgi:hypothetical protein